MNDNLAYQEEAWEELIDGQLVAMSPRPVLNHNCVVAQLTFLFKNYLRGRTCRLFTDGALVFLTEKDIFVPDLMIVCDRSKLQADGVHGAPDLVIEVLSHSTAKRDRGYKKDVYAKCGVREYWLVNPTDKSVEIYLPQDGDLRLHEIYSIYPDATLGLMKEEERAALQTRFKCSLYDDFEISLEDIFQDLIFF